jgi:hypothetical protein
MARISFNNRRAKKAYAQQGVMLIIVLIFLAVASYASLKSSEIWTTVVARENEQELLFIGDQYRKAIERYYYAKPPNERTLPKNLMELVKDDRFPAAQHHLRKLYTDPITGSTLQEQRSSFGITGVYSLSDKKPIKRTGFDTPYEKFDGKQTYRDWKFIFTPPDRRQSPTTTTVVSAYSPTPSIKLLN